MGGAETIATWDMLGSLGFEPDDQVFSDVMPGLSCDFGALRLTASCVVSPRGGEVVLFGGVLATSRSIAEVYFEMPRRVASLEQCAAWIVWHLDEASGTGTCVPTRPLTWVAEAREHLDLLPWVAKMRAYEARPHCQVKRDWLRVGLKALEGIFATTRDDELVEFGFDGRVLSIRCGSHVVPLSAQGEPWPRRYVLQVGGLRRLPKRLMREDIEVGIWDARLHLAGRAYGGVREDTP